MFSYMKKDFPQCKKKYVYLHKVLVNMLLISTEYLFLFRRYLFSLHVSKE